MKHPLIESITKNYQSTSAKDHTYFAFPLFEDYSGHHHSDQHAGGLRDQKCTTHQWVSPHAAFTSTVAALALVRTCSTSEKISKINTIIHSTFVLEWVIVSVDWKLRSYRGFEGTPRANRAPLRTSDSENRQELSRHGLVRPETTKQQQQKRRRQLRQQRPKAPHWYFRELRIFTRRFTATRKIARVRS